MCRLMCVYWAGLRRYFLQYLLDNDDDSPLYIFDHQFPRDRVVREIVLHAAPHLSVSYLDWLPCLIILGIDRVHTC